MRQWGHSPFKTTGTEETPQFLLRWEQATPTARFSHSFSVIPENADNEEEQRNIFLRILCHYAINSLPDKSLLELVESLKAMIEFYRPLPSKPLLVTTTREARAKIGQRITRPVFQIGEE
jgi:hypothetical protein